MDVASSAIVPLQILIVDLLLGADNALVIALACRRLPRHEIRQAAAIGVGGAILLRIALALIASSLLTLPLVKLIAGVVLMLIALNLSVGDEIEEAERRARSGVSLWSAAAIILVADTAMSLDNVVALAAIAQGNVLWLSIGVMISLPIIAFGGVMLADGLKRAPWLVEIGAALLGWIALQMAVSDATFGGALAVNAPGLVALAPALGAVFVFVYGRFVAPRTPAEVVEILARTDYVPARFEPSPAVSPPPPQPDFDPGPEPDDRREPAPPATREDRVAIIGVLLLAVVAGTILMVVSWLDAFN